MGIVKNIGKILKDTAMVGVVPPSMGQEPASAVFGSLADHLGAERKQHGKSGKESKKK